MERTQELQKHCASTESKRVRLLEAELGRKLTLAEREVIGKYPRGY